MDGIIIVWFFFSPPRTSSSYPRFSLIFPLRFSVSSSLVFLSDVSILFLHPFLSFSSGILVGVYLFSQFSFPAILIPISVQFFLSSTIHLVLVFPLIYLVVFHPFLDIPTLSTLVSFPANLVLLSLISSKIVFMFWYSLYHDLLSHFHLLILVLVYF